MSDHVIGPGPYNPTPEDIAREQEGIRKWFEENAPGCTFARFWDFEKGSQERPCSCGAVQEKTVLTDEVLAALSDATNLTALEEDLVGEVITLREARRHALVIYDQAYPEEHAGPCADAACRMARRLRRTW
jgi:hypothetical protein